VCADLYAPELRFAQKRIFDTEYIAFAIFGREILQRIEAQRPANTAGLIRAILICPMINSNSRKKFYSTGNGKDGQ